MYKELNVHKRHKTCENCYSPTLKVLSRRVRKPATLVTRVAVKNLQSAYFPPPPPPFPSHLVFFAAVVSSRHATHATHATGGGGGGVTTLTTLLQY